ncbi:hypothetical protein JCM8547_000857 [Rhodosporidiobolus lusitaniae]
MILTSDLLNTLPTAVNGTSKPSNGASPTSNGISSASLVPTAHDAHRQVVTELLEAHGGPLELSGYSLTLGDVVETARNSRKVQVPHDGDIAQRVNDSVKFLQSKCAVSPVLSRAPVALFVEPTDVVSRVTLFLSPSAVSSLTERLHTSIYGVTSGFGGSADTRTEDADGLQKALLEHQLSGVLPTALPSTGGFSIGRGLENALPLEVVRGAMAIRINSLTRGHSAVRLVVLDALVNFLNFGITPIVPLRGSISASGDLSPLSYIASAITGHPDVRVHVVHDGNEQILPAREAISLFGLEPVVLGAKEGLGLVNGTAVSASCATLALHDAHSLALLAQATTALTVEALVGQQGSFHPFLHDETRPHPQQIEVARNVRALLNGSSFAVEKEEELSVKDDEGWLGPIVSDLVNAHSILSVEVNSTTDNPIIDVQEALVHHGGAFMAMSVTNAMEKTRLGLAQIGKLSFTQLTEMINCQMNRGLPSCLAGSEPSLNYHCKGIDIHAAAYTSELGHLANPVSTFVQPAEQSNQAVNSLALISARRTAEANDVLTMLLASHLYGVLQAIDLRALELDFKTQFEPLLAASIEKDLGAFVSSPADLVKKVKKALNRRFEQTGSYDLEPRWQDAFSFATGVVVEEIATSPAASVSTGGNSLLVVHNWATSNAQQAVALTHQLREQFWSTHASASGVSDAPALKYLGKGTRKLYEFVRGEVGVKARRGDVHLGVQEATIGSSVSRIYEAIRDGRINRVLVEATA